MFAFDWQTIMIGPSGGISVASLYIVQFFLFKLLTFVGCYKHWYKSKCGGAGEDALCLLFSWMKLRMCLAHVKILTNTKSWNISSSSSWSSTKIICKDKWRLSHSLIMTSWFFWSSDMCPLWGAQAWFCFWRLWGLWKKQWMTTTCSTQNFESSMDGCYREELIHGCAMQLICHNQEFCHSKREHH